MVSNKIFILQFYEKIKKDIDLYFRDFLPVYDEDEVPYFEAVDNIIMKEMAKANSSSQK